MHSVHKSQHRLKCPCIYTYIYMKHNNPHIICHSDFILKWLQDVAVRDNRNSLLWDNDKVMHKTVSSLNIATKEHLAVCRQFNCKSMKNVTGNSVTRLSWCNKTSSVQSITISGVREMILLWRNTRLHSVWSSFLYSLYDLSNGLSQCSVCQFSTNTDFVRSVHSDLNYLAVSTAQALISIL